MSVDDDATCDRVAHGWYGAVPGIPLFRPSGVPECCGAVMRCLGVTTGWKGEIERQTVEWVCRQCVTQLSMTLSVWADNASASCRPTATTL